VIPAMTFVDALEDFEGNDHKEDEQSGAWRKG
jgi:hypothetical protein